MIHFIAQVTNKRFFLTHKEQKDAKDQPLSLCPNCKEDDAAYGYLKQCKGYRKHIIFDLLKDKADLFYSKMQERRVLELTSASNERASENCLSQDSENYDEQEAERKSDTNSEAENGGFFQIKWKSNRGINKDPDEDDQFDYLSESIRNSQKNLHDLSVCDDRDDINTIYSELDQSMAQKQKKLIANQNSLCSVCQRHKESCIVLNT